MGNMNSENDINLNVFANTTRKLCVCCFVAMILIILFIMSPLSNLIKTSAVMKLLILVLLGYTIYLNFIQTSSLRNSNLKNKSSEIVSQLNTNIVCSYVFIFFLMLLIFFVIKSFF